MVKIYWPNLGKRTILSSKNWYENTGLDRNNDHKIFNEVDDPCCRQNIINGLNLYFKIDTENVVVWVK